MIHHSPRASRHVHRVAIAVVLQAEQVLVGRRPLDKPLGGLWEFPGGKLRPGETPEQAAVRECREETGIDIAVDGLLGRWTRNYAHASVELNFLACHPRPSCPPPQRAFRWIPRAALWSLKMPPANWPIQQTLATP